jgi:hypothetical protein
MGVPSDRWGVQSEEALIVGVEHGTEDGWKRIERTALARASTDRHGATLVHVTSELNGSTLQFGNQLWKLIAGACPDLKQRFESGTADLIELSYSDRYLKAPLPVLLLLRALTALKETVGSRWRVTNALLATTPCDPAAYCRRIGRVSDDWRDSTIRDAVIAEAFGNALSTRVELNVLTHKDIAHARTLTLGFGASGSGRAIDIVRVLLDQGFGYWKSQEAARGLASRTDFNFSSEVTQQAGHLRQVNFSVRGQDYPTVIAAAVEGGTGLTGRRQGPLAKTL